jgi:hypothetical protein
MPSRTPFGPRAPARRGETAGVPPGFAARTVLRPYTGLNSPVTAETPPM